MATRLEGWEERLAVVIEAARTTPYSLGEHDCWSVACATIAALTGGDHWPEFAGKYKTKKQALALIATYGNSWQEAFAAFLGVQPISPLMARRGDLVTYEDDNGKHMGICLGTHVAVLGEKGLASVPITSPALLEAWRIG